MGKIADTVQKVEADLDAIKNVVVPGVAALQQQIAELSARIGSTTDDSLTAESQAALDKLGQDADQLAASVQQSFGNTPA